MIDVSEYINKLENIKTALPNYLNELCFSYKYHMRIITDEPISFPKNYEIIGHDDYIEISNQRWDKHERNGWSKPDFEFNGIELRYLWKQFKPQKINNAN